MRIIVAAGMATALNSAAAFSFHVPSVASLAGERNVAINCRGASVFGARVNAQRLRGPPALRQSGTPLDQARALPPLDLTEENVNKALEETKEVLGTIFGNTAENRKIGITGDVQLADIDGPFIIVRLVGRFWHKRADVLSRVENYVLARIPEAIELQIEDPAQLDDTMVEGGYEIQPGEGPAGNAER